jgi:hypothetical protein
MGALDLIRKGVKGVKNAPFFSKVDEVLDSLPRNKGTGDEFLREIEKTKGVKPAEIQDRGISKALKGKPKMTKAEVQKIFESNPPPRVQEKVLSSDVPDYDDWLENKAQEIYGVDWFELRKDEQKALEKMYGDLDLTQYDRYKTPGGENYREILLKLPAFDNKRIMELEADIRRSEGAYKDPMSMPDFRAKVEELAQLKDQQAAAGTSYISSHYKTDPNLLAHIRVQDFKTPDGKKVLLVDEIQSDWHQEGRKKGYATKENLESWYNQNKLEGDPAFADLNSEQVSVLERNRGAGMGGNNAVPDAPFKKNWHELAMKRVLDYAAENGYDSIAITPGAEQAKRYDLSKQIKDVHYNQQKGVLVAYDLKGNQVVRQEGIEPDKVEDFVGKEVAERLLSAPPEASGYSTLSGLDLQVGGEGMKGFYDKILPDYLNNFGKQYGASVGQMDLITKPEKKIVNIMDPDEPDISPAEMMKFHSFDITPQLRDEVKNKGLPLYGKMGMGPEGLAAGTGAATIGSEVFDTNNEQQVQNPVHFTENPDAMLLELMQRN